MSFTNLSTLTNMFVHTHSNSSTEGGFLIRSSMNGLIYIGEIQEKQSKYHISYIHTTILLNLSMSKNICIVASPHQFLGLRDSSTQRSYNRFLQIKTKMIQNWGQWNAKNERRWRTKLFEMREKKQLQHEREEYLFEAYRPHPFCPCVRGLVSA